MNSEHKTILKVLEDYLMQNPNMRFSQALFNLNINQFAKEECQENEERLLRDIYNDKDDAVLARVLARKIKFNL